MGTKYEITAWVRNPDPTQPGEGYGQEYYRRTEWGGWHLLPALWALWRAKCAGHGMVALEVRA